MSSAAVVIVLSASAIIHREGHGQCHVLQGEQCISASSSPSAPPPPPESLSLIYEGLLITRASELVKNGRIVKRG